jgi:hypothetical protein
LEYCGAMERRQRLLLIGLAAVVAAVGFILARPDDEDNPPPPRSAAREEAREADRPAPPPGPQIHRIRVRDGRPVGGVKRISAEKGERVRIVIRSEGTTDEVHLHGYDLFVTLEPGRPTRLAFTAKLEGVFEVELEGTHVQIAKLTVTPS